jgi:predicted transcriptional regulator
VLALSLHCITTAYKIEEIAMAENPVFSVRVAPALRRKLDRVAAALDRPRSWIVTRALESYVEQQAWQIAETARGLAEADAGDFASAAEVKAAFARAGGKRTGGKRAVKQRNAR